MIIALSVKNKLAFIDGTITKPDDSKAELINAWIKNNNMVITWILNSISKEISASVIYASTAHEIWNDLKDRFQQKNGPCIFQLRRDLMNLTQDQSSVSVYFTKIKNIWEELSNYRPTCSCGKCTCGGVKESNNYYQMEYMMAFLMGLHNSFSQIRGQLLLMYPLPSINKVFALVSQEENQRRINTDQNREATFAFKSNNVKMTTGFEAYSNKPRFGSTGYIKKKERAYCAYCNIHGQSIDKCYKIHGYPHCNKPRSRDNSSSHNSINQISASFITQNEDKQPSIQQHGIGNFVQNLNSTQY
ncbi:uncharacterized protein LOC111374937 [Olea europaea var. sylvestris]|uniref:uncharacterized protein LOC111374937 n=1 Tax=Olea europaea var. sylvestris TaxID=158386 RepID=UPI000C1D28D5|nr:uncharacterized protein LOC111374937 [Olea europaea var. sylvestris]